MRIKKNFNNKFVNIHKLKLILSFLIIVVYTLPMHAQVWTLRQCIDTAQIYNKNIQIGRNNIALSEQKLRESKANLIPKVNALSEYKYYTDLPYQLMPQSAFGGAEGEFKETQIGVPHNINLNLQFTMPLYSPQIYGSIKTTGIASKLSELQYKKTEEQIFFEISNLYYNAQILQHQISFVEKNLVNTTILLKNMQLLFEQLMIKETDVSKVRLQKAQLITQHELISSNYEQVMNSLKFSIGIPFNQNIQIESEIHYQNNHQYISRTIIDIQLANTQTSLLTSELSTLKNSRLPSVSLYGYYGTTAYGYNESPNEFLKFFALGFAGLQVSYPLFNGTITKRKINQKRIEIQNSELQLNLATEQNTMLIENARHQRNAAQSTVKMTSDQIKLAQSVYEQSVLQQKEGIATLTDVLLADNALQDAQQYYLSVVVNYLKADLELKKLTGNMTSIVN